MLERIGNFDVIRELGRGGMGVVYLALDTRLDRNVAIKALPVELASDPVRLERFEREAKTLAQLNHPHLAGIHGVEEQDGNRYLVLEFVEGQSLGDLLDRGPLPVDEAIEVAVQIAAGVEAAHEAGITHRDLKPANIMITPEGKAKVLDFGLARTDDGAQSSTGELDSPTLTTPNPQHSPTIAGAILGTAAYMSPEQARGRRVDKRTDIWSFGVVLYEMLVGASPFVGETVSDSIGAVLHKQLDLEQLPSQTPASVRRVLRRCLERDKGLRYRDIGDVRLELLNPSEPKESVVATASAGRRTLAGAGWVAAMVFGLLAVFALIRSDVNPAPLHASVVMPDGVRVEQVAVSLDGRRLVIIGRVFETGRPDASFRHIAYVRELSSGDMQQVDVLDDPWYAAFSPDGRWIAFAVNSANGIDSEIMRLPADLSGSPTRLCSLNTSARVQGRGWFSWTPDNNIAFHDGATMELVVVSAGTGEEIRRVPIAGDEIDRPLGGFIGPFGDRWVTLGQPMFTDNGYREDVLLVDTITGEAVRPIRGAANAVLADDDRVLFTRGSQIFESGFDQHTLQITGEIRPVHEGLAADVAWGDGRFNISPTGVLAYRPGGVRGTKRTIVQLDMNFNETPWSTEERSFETDIIASTDMQRMAVVASSVTGLYEVWVADTERRRFRKLLGEPGLDFSDPHFSPDGETIIATRGDFSSESADQLVSVPFDGTATPEVIYTTQPGGLVTPFGISPDGKWILARLGAFMNDATYVEIPIEGGLEPRVLLGLEPGTLDLSYAPTDIPLISYISSQSGQRHLYVRKIEDGRLGTEVRVSDDEVVAGGWHDFDVGDGKSEAVVSYLGADRKVYTRPVWSDGRIRIGERSGLPDNGSQYLDVGGAPGLGGFAIKRGEDEAPITRVDIVTNWLELLNN